MSTPYAWSTSIVAPDAGGQGHVDYLQLSRLMYDAWSAYLVPGLGLSRDEVHGGAVKPIVKGITGRFDAEVQPGEPLRCVARAVSRTRRAFTIEVVLRRDSGDDPVATGTVTLVAFEPATGQAVEVPAALWAAVEALEGREIPISGPAPVEAGA